MKTSSLAVSLFGLILFLSSAAFSLDEIVATPKQAPAHQPAAIPKEIDIAICLDVSGSMSGLINSARAKLWAIVSDLALAKPTPKLRVALVTFGHDTYDANAGWVRVDADLTDDLDKISESLFALKTKGGTELVGRVLQTSLDRLHWSKQKDALKIIIVAGNESADQDQEVSFRDVCQRAITNGIIVNSIYCARVADRGPDNIAAGWKEVALRADGQFHSIDANHGTVTINTPFDARLAELATALNATYIPLGSEGRRGSANQVLQDSNAGKLGKAVEASRQNAKASSLYLCRWCLVDAYRNKQIKLEDVKQEDLPEALRGKTQAELTAHINKTFAEREKIQVEIRELNKKRAMRVAAVMKEKNLKDDNAFDAAVRKSIRSQAGLKGYAFPEDTRKETK